MLRFCLLLAAAVLPLASSGLAQEGPYKLLKTVKVGGDGEFDYITADSNERRLYVPRRGPNGRISVYNLDTLEPEGEIKARRSHSVAIDPKSHHGFGTSVPVVMFDTKTLATIKTIDVETPPDGSLFDPFNQRIWIFSHLPPFVTILDSKDGSVVGTLDVGGAPEQAVADGKGHIYVDLEDTDEVAAIDAAALKVTAHYELAGKGGGPGSLAIDVKNHVLFVGCRHKNTAVIMKSDDGKILDVLPIGGETDGAVFNPSTMEAFFPSENGPLTVIKENSPTSFTVEQKLDTRPGEPCTENHPCAKTLTLDTKTNHILLIAAEFGPMPPNAPENWIRPILSFSVLVVGR
jgi:DNA-binding beta-propeller fold protein YncE